MAPVLACFASRSTILVRKLGLCDLSLYSQLVPLEELDEDMSIMGGREVVLDHRTLFR